MKKKFYELVLEGHFDTIYGLFEGFMLGKKKKYQYWFHKHAGVGTVTLTEVIQEWVTFKHKVHHIIIGENFHNDFKAVLQSKKQHPHINKEFVKSVKMIKSASFNFDFTTYGKKYADDFKKTIKKCNKSKALKIENYKEDEEIIPEGHGIERYAPEHEYNFKATGTVTGELDEMIEFRKTLCDNPLCEAEEISIKM